MENENQLAIIVKESGLDTTKAQFILDKFQDYFAIAADWEKKAKGIVVTSETQTAEMDMAKIGRLFLRDKRIAIEKARKELKEQALREGKAIDGIANVLKALIVPIEEYLEQQEKFVELKRKAEEEERKKQEQLKAEAERVAKEKAEKEEQEKIRKENELLRLKAIEQEKKIAEERKKAAAEKEKQEKERKELQRRLEKEAAEKEKLKKEKKEMQIEIKSAKNKATQIVCPFCGKEFEINQK